MSYLHKEARAPKCELLQSRVQRFKGTQVWDAVMADQHRPLAAASELGNCKGSPCGGAMAAAWIM
jgi:hypothetical protein